MLLQEKLATIERSSAFNETGFKIRASAKAFKILSSGLYSDKIRAIVRELGTNAADSHVMAGKADMPFHVHLPNALEPWFSIRDFGTGLSPQDVEGIYTTYFESNKTSSNDVTGCLGLGSKSPFSYTDSFTVTSYFNGRKYVYAAFMNEHGLPSVANLSEEDTQEANGIEVIFPVNNEDFKEFAEKAKLVYEYFKVRPIISGQTIKFNDEKPTYVGTLPNGNVWRLYNYTYASDHLLIMGNVVYPISMILAGCNDSRYRILFDKVRIEIKCGIGQAEMTASREALEYTDLTKATIKEACEDALTHWSTLLEADLVKQPTYWDACLFYKENSLWFKQGITWGGRTLSHRIKLDKTMTCSIGKYAYGKVEYAERQSIDEILVDNSYVFAHDDLTRGTKLRVMQYVRQNKNNPRVFVFKFADYAQREAFAKQMGFPVDRIINTSSLPKIVRPKNPNAGKKCVYLYNQNGRNNRSYWDTVDLKSVPEGGTYVFLDKWEVPGFGNASNLGDIMANMEAAGYPIGKLYGVRTNVLKKVVNNPKWLKLQDRITEVQRKHEHEKELISNVSTYLQLADLLIFKNRLSGIDISGLLDKIEYVKNNKSKLYSLTPIVCRNGYFSDTVTTALIEEVKKKYPLLFFIMENERNPLRWPVDAIVEYINLVNKK